MLARNFTRNLTMNVDNIIQDNVQDKIFSSVLFTLVNLPYRNNSIDIDIVSIDDKDYLCYKNHYRFDNGTMVIIKIASSEFIPYGIYGRKIINFIIAEFTYKMNLPHIYDKTACRMIKLGKKPIDFIEKLSGKRNSGSSSAKSILQQLQAILNCRMAIATGYKQINPADDEILADDKYQFALVESFDDQLINHKFDVTDGWQEEIYISGDLAKILSQHIMPLDCSVYNNISSPMELDIYQYFTYQNYHCIKRGTNKVDYNWDEIQKLFGRGYAKTSTGTAHFRSDFRKNLGLLQTKVQLQISAPCDAKQISFIPSQLPTIYSQASSTKWGELEYEIYKPIIKDLPTVRSESNTIINTSWNEFSIGYGLINKFDNNAIKVIRAFFIKDVSYTIDTIKYVDSANPRNWSAFVVDALNNSWIKKNSEFMQRVKKTQNMLDSLTKQELQKINKLANIALDFLDKRYSPEGFDLGILVAVYLQLNACPNEQDIFAWLEGSKYQVYFERHKELLAH